MRKIIVSLILFLAALAAGAQTASLSGYCVTGASQAKTSGLPSANFQQGIIPKCTVTVFNTGTTNLAMIFSNNSGGALTNPFSANLDGSWLFYAAINLGYDVQLSGPTGGISPNVYLTPKTLTGLYPGTNIIPGAAWFVGNGAPSLPCSAVQNNGAFYTSNTLILYQCSNVTGPYQFNIVGSIGFAYSAPSVNSIPVVSNGAAPGTGVNSTLSDTGRAATPNGIVSTPEPIKMSQSRPLTSPAADFRAYGGVADGVTDIGPALTSAIDACNAGGSCTVILPCGFTGGPTGSAGCFLANGSSLSWPNGVILKLQLQGVLNLGSTLVVPDNITLIGDALGIPVQFQGKGAAAEIIGPNVKGTMGTAIVSTNTPVTFTPTFTSGTIANMPINSAITIAGTTTCSASATRAGNIVTATCSGYTRMPIQTLATITGCSDSSFNITTPIVNADYPAHTLTWSQTASNSTATGCTVTGFNEDTFETVRITNVSGSTVTATFAHTHSSSDQWGMVGVTAAFNTFSHHDFENIAFSGAPGMQFWAENIANLYLTNDGFQAGQFMTSGAAEFDDEFVGSITKSSFLGALNRACVGGACIQPSYPYGLRCSQLPPSLSNNGVGCSGTPATDTFIEGGEKVDTNGFAATTFGSGPTTPINNVTFEQASGGDVVIDARFNLGFPIPFIVTNSGPQDNFLNSPECYVQATDGGGGFVQLNGTEGVATSCLANKYFNGFIQVNGLSAMTLPTGRNAATGSFDDGSAEEKELRGEGAGLGASVVPFTTLPVVTSPSCGTCSTVLGPDGTSDGLEIQTNAGSGVNVTVGFNNLSTYPGDWIIFWSWNKAGSNNTGTCQSGLGSNSCFSIFSFGTDTFTQSITGNIVPVNFGMIFNADWWHPQVAMATVLTGETAAHQVQLRLSSPSSGTGSGNDFWGWGMMFIPGPNNPSYNGVTEAEVERWRQQLLHGAVPQNFSSVGTAATTIPIAAPKYNVLVPSTGAIHQINTRDLGDYSTSVPTNGQVPVYSTGSGTYVPTTLAAGGVTSINTVTGDFIFTGAGVSCTSTTCTFSGSGSGTSVEVNGGSGLAVANLANNTGAGEIDFTNPVGSTVNATLHNTATTPNGQTCTLGSTCNVNNGAATHSVALNEGAGAAIGGATIGTAGRMLIDQGASADPAFEAMSGDATLAGSGAITFATVNGGPGSCGDATHVCQVTTNGKGLVTTQTAVLISGSGVTIQTLGTNNSSQTTLNFQASTVNADGLTITPTNPSGGNEQYEITGNALTLGNQNATSFSEGTISLAGSTTVGSSITLNGSGASPGSMVVGVTPAGTTLNIGADANITNSGVETLGVSGTAGSLVEFNNTSTTTWASAATTSNTIKGFASSPTNNDLIYCATSGTVCTLTDAGYAFSAIPLSDLAQIAGTSLLGNSTGSTAAVTAAYTVGNTGTSIPQLSGGLLAASILPKATSAAFGAVEGDGSTITLSAGVISCTTSTTSQLGCVKPDGTTITISGGGVITASGSALPNSVTFNNSGSGGASGSTFNGSSPLTVSYNTLGAAAAPTNWTLEPSSFSVIAGGGYQYTGSGGATATLPASVSTGFQAAIANVGTGTVTMATGGPTYTGVATVPPGYTVNFYTDGTNFYSTIPILTFTNLTFTAGSTGNTLALTATNVGTAINIAANSVLYSGGTSSAVLGTTPVNSAVLVTNGSGVPSESTAVPNGVTATTQSAGDTSNDIATDSFVSTAVNNAIGGVNPAVAVLAASTGSNITGTYNNGSSGIGASFTVTATGAFSLDGVAINTIGQRVLLKDQSSAFQNGVYTATVVGTTGVSPVFTRALDYDQPSDINSTGAIPVQSGTANATTSWLLTSTVNTVGTDALTYTQFSLAPTSIVTAAANFTSGNLVKAAASNKTTADSGIAAANVVLASSPGAGIAHFAGSTQTVTSSAVSLTADVSGVLPSANGGVATATKARAIAFNFGTPEATGTLASSITRYATVPYGCTISAYNLLADTGTFTVKFWKIATGTAIPTVSNSISTSGVSLATGTALHSTTVTDFTTTTVTANDIIAANITAISGPHFVQAELECDTQ